MLNKNVAQKRENGKGVKEEFTGKNLTGFGGVGLLRRFFNKIGLVSELQRIEIDHKKSGYPGWQMFLSMIYGVLLGLPRPYHMLELSRDRVFQKVAELDGFPHQSTISRFLNKAKVKLSRKIYSVNLSMLKKVRSGFRDFLEITLDLDSHVTPVYGNQQRAALGYNPLEGEEELPPHYLLHRGDEGLSFWNFEGG
jgi:hypothetical protein